MGAYVRALPISIGCFLMLASAVAESAGLSQSQRDAILKGTYHMCVDGVPREVSNKYGELAVKRFCSCYADELASKLTKEQFEAMIVDPKTGRSRPPANYQNTVRDANRVCAPELSAQ